MNGLDNLVDSASGDISLAPVRAKIEELELELSKHPQVDIPVTHRYSGGIYAREIIIPKGAMLTGRIYKEDHFDVMVSGDVTVTGCDGKKRLKGFHIFEGNRGKKRAGYAHEDTHWITFHSSPEMAADDYIYRLTSNSFAEFEQEVKLCDVIQEHEIVNAYKASGSQVEYTGFRDGYLSAKGKPSKVEADILDYNLMLEETGFTEEVVRAQSEDESDQMVLVGDFGVSLGDSVINGIGLYSTKGFLPGEVIMPARIDGKRTIAGRYVNHSFAPNSIMKLNNGIIELVATRVIAQEEITVNYRESLKAALGAKS